MQEKTGKLEQPQETMLKFHWLFKMSINVSRYPIGPPSCIIVPSFTGLHCLSYRLSSSAIERRSKLIPRKITFVAVFF